VLRLLLRRAIGNHAGVLTAQAAIDSIANLLSFARTGHASLGCGAEAFTHEN